MASALPPILVEIQADVAQLKKGLADANTALKGMDDNVKQANTGMTNFIGKLKQVGATLGATFAATQLTQFAKDTVMAASNMAESVSKVAVVFGDGASEVYKFGEAAATNMGISNQAALEAAGTYGNLFQAFGMGQGEAQKMSMSLVQLASDMASFNNTSVDDAILALRSGLSGETEPLKRFGIALNDVRLKAEAAALGLGEYKGVLPPLVKSQAAYSLIMKDSALAQGDYARTASGTANTMKTLQARFADAKVAIGEALMPAFRGLLQILNIIIPVLTSIGKFFKENGEAIRIYTGLVLGVIVAFKTYQATLILIKVTQQAYVVATTLMKGAQLASIASTNGLAASMLALNAAMRANPVGIIVTAVLALGAAFIYAWKKSETFRAVVIKAIQGILTVVGKLVEGFGMFFKMIGKVPGMGWAKGIADGAQNAADKIALVSKNLDDLNRKAAVGNFQMSTGTTLGTATTPRAATADPKAAEKAKKEEERLKKIATLQKQLKDVYKDMNEVIVDAKEKAAEALERRDERIAEAHERHTERVAELNERYKEQLAEADERYQERRQELTNRYNETIAEIDNRYAEEKAEAQKRFQEAETTARKRNADTLIKISKDYTRKELELQKTLQEKITDLKQKAVEKAADLTAKAAEKQAGIIQQSIGRLTGAFASGTAVALGDLFKKGKGTDLVGTFKKQLDDVKALQSAAGELAGSGYSQTFIEQVVKAGPEAGLAMMEQIRELSPEQQDELKKTYAALETINDTGLDTLADSMNKGANLATSELRKAYEQVAIDLKDSLATVDKELQEGMAEANKVYQENLTAAKIARDEAIAEAAAALTEALAEAQKDLDNALAEAFKTMTEAKTKAKEELNKGLAEALKDLEKARKDAQEELNKGLAEAQKTLQKALIDAQKDYEKAIDEINKATQKKLDELKAKIAEIAAALKKLGEMQAAASAMANAPVFTPITAATAPKTTSTTTATNGNSTTVNITGVNLTNPTDTANTVVNSIKFGNVVVPTQPTALASKESGAIGAASIAARTVTVPKLDQSYISMRAR